MTAHPPLDAWRPLSPEVLSRVFEPLGVRWWIAGGIAIDLHLGRTTRAHGDVDVALVRDDYPRLAELLGAFDLYVVYDGTLTRWHGEPLHDERHQFWVCRAGDDAWAFEVLLEYTEGNDWLYRRDPRIRRAIAEFGGHNAGGVPYMRPDVALLYKSNRPELDRNGRDFDAMLPALSREERAWLRDALLALDGAHPWLARLDG